MLNSDSFWECFYNNIEELLNSYPQPKEVVGINAGSVAAKTFYEEI